MKTITSEDDRTVIMSDGYLNESGLQGGKIIGEHLAVGCVIIGIPFLLIGFSAFFCMFFGLGYPTNTAVIIGAFLITFIGLFLIIGGYLMYRDKHKGKLLEKQSS